MNRSESIVNLSKALFKFQSKIDNIYKDSINPFHKNKYASLTSILEGIKDPLMESSLVIMQNPGSGEGGAITLNTIIMHSETAEYMESEFSMMPVKKDPQGIGSCITYMRRYALASILKLNVDDDDGNHASDVKNKSNNLNQALGLEKNKRKSESYTKMKNAIGMAQTEEDLVEVAKSIKKEVTNSDDLSELKLMYKDRLREIN